MNIKPIRTNKDYENALVRIEALIDAKENSKEFDELEILSTLIENYEEKHFKIDVPDPIEAIKFRMEQEGLKQKDIAQLFGNKTRVSEVLNRKRRLTLDMVRNLHNALNIPYESLLNKYDLQKV